MRKSLLYMICSILLLTSCHYKDLEYSDRLHNMRVVFHWDEAPDAKPESMLMYVFSGEAQPVVIPFADINGGPASLAPANYQFIAMNDGTELLTRNTTWEAFEIYAPETSLAGFSRMFAANRAVPVATGTEDQHYFLQPEPLETDGKELVVLTNSTETIDFIMHEAVKHYYFIVRGLNNLDHLVTVTATVSGMSESWLGGYGRCTDTQCQIPFEMEILDNQSVTGHIDSFGHCPGNEKHQHLLTVYYEMDNGQKFYAVFDVTNQLHDPDHVNGGDDPIIVEGQTIPYNDEPADKGGMLNPEVEEWTEINEDIYL